MFLPIGLLNANTTIAATRMRQWMNDLKYWSFGFKVVIYTQALWTAPSGYVKIAIETDHRNSGFSH